MDVRRGDIYMADLTGDSIDSVCRVRPVLIVQNNKGNAHSTSYIAALITSKPKKFLPTHVMLDKSCGLRKNSTVLCEHLVTVRREMLMEYIGTIVNTDDESKVNKALSVSLELRK
jgi:mRNA interferase MazF